MGVTINKESIKIMESVTNFLTWPQFISFRLFRSENADFSLQSKKYSKYKETIQSSTTRTQDSTP